MPPDLSELKKLRDYLVEQQKITPLDSIDKVIVELNQQIDNHTNSVFDQNSQVVNTQINVAHTYVAASKVNPDTNRHAYLNYVRRKSENVPVTGLNLSLNVSNPNLVRNQQIRLIQTYIDLETNTISERIVPYASQWQDELRDWIGDYSVVKTHRITALEAVIHANRIVLLGAPGSGKTTFLRYLSLCLASAQIEGEGEWTRYLAGWDVNNWKLTPVFISLREFNRWLKRRSSVGNAKLIWDYLKELLDNLGVPDFFNELQQDIYEKKAIILLDGLDELDLARREIIHDAITNLCETCDSKFVITCRTLTFLDPRWNLKGFTSFELAPLNEKQIDLYVSLWHKELINTGAVKEIAARELEARFKETLRSSDLWDMASNPLLLSSMILVHTHEGFLHQTRALLYEDCVDLLLWQWEELKIPNIGMAELVGISTLLHKAGLQKIDFKQVCWKISYHLLKEQLDDISIQDLVEAFRQIHPSREWGWASEIVTLVQERAGLIIEHLPGRFGFPHRTFQEFLAASFLSSQDDFAKIAAQLAKYDIWREVILLAVGRSVHISGNISKALDLVAEILMNSDIEQQPDYGMFGCEILSEIGILRAQDRKLGQELLQKAHRLLTVWINSDTVNLRRRKLLGEILSELGDPRFESKGLYLPRQIQYQEEVFWGFVFISEGPFTMSEGRETHTYSLPGYYISRYPVTEGQYWAFIMETNRTVPNHWLHGRPKQNRLNCPVVNISWYDALSYCRWLTRRLGNQELNPSVQKIWDSTDKLILIPSEAEWEKACRGKDDNRRFAWGNEFSVERANVKGLEFSAPVSVGLFPQGVSPYGIFDMGGNIREWTTTKYWDEHKERYRFPYNSTDGRDDLSRNDNITRVIKGNDFHMDSLCSSCSYRTRNFPVDCHPYIGFRLVIHLKTELT